MYIGLTVYSTFVHMDQSLGAINCVIDLVSYGWMTMALLPLPVYTVVASFTNYLYKLHARYFKMPRTVYLLTCARELPS